MTDNQIRLQRAKDALEIAREREIQARRALNEASETRQRAKERYEELFRKEEQEEVERRKADYRHSTK